jgi:hypothetical protein
MHKKILFAVGLTLVAVSAALPATLTFASCGLLAVMTGVGYFGMGAVLKRRPLRVEYADEIRAFTYAAVLGTVINFGIIIPVCLKTFTGTGLYMTFGMMAATTGFVFGWLACVLKHSPAQDELQEACR